MYLSARASHVHMLIRGSRLSSTMSDYLVQRILASKAITLHPCSEVGEKSRLEAEHLFVMIREDPCTAWLRDCVDLDGNGFVRTSSGSEDRGPCETPVRGIFAVGDVRSGSVKRVALQSVRVLSWCQPFTGT